MGVWTPGPGATGGDDNFTGDATAETADGLAGNDALHGEGGDDHLIGGSGSDTLDGGDGADTLDGGDGDDLFIQSTNFVSADTITGGAGFDLLFYGFSGERVTVQISGGYATGGNGLI